MIPWLFRELNGENGLNHKFERNEKHSALRQLINLFTRGWCVQTVRNHLDHDKICSPVLVPVPLSAVEIQSVDVHAILGWCLDLLRFLKLGHLPT